MLNIDSKTNKITIVNGDTGNINFAIENYKLKEGDTVFFTVKSHNGNEELVKKIQTFNEDGSCLIYLTKDDTFDLSGIYYYDVQVNLKDGRVDTIIGPARFYVIKGLTEADRD